MIKTGRTTSNTILFLLTLLLQITKFYVKKKKKMLKFVSTVG